MPENAGISFYFSNSYKRLASLFTEVHRQTADLSPFVKEHVIVQTRGMQKWLSLQVAAADDVFANFEFLGVSSFFRKLYCRLGNVPESASVYSVQVLKWIIYRILQQRVENEAHFAVIREYADGDAYKMFQLASSLADLFEQYMIYRPRMIEKWGEGSRYFREGGAFIPHDHELWQMTLWRYIKACIPGDIPDRVQLRERLSGMLETTEGKSAIRKVFGTQVSVFGITVMPEYFLPVFEKLARHIRVHFFLMNPSPAEYWFDIVSRKEKLQQEKKHVKENEIDPALLHFEVGNPLLASLGKVGRDFLSAVYTLESAHTNAKEAFVVNSSGTLLSSIKADITSLRDRTETGEKGTFCTDDRSVEIVSCYSPLREAEVLSDIILDMFNSKTRGFTGLKASDILVVTPDIDTYSPYIDQVFSRFDGSDQRKRPFIPYTIADRSFHRENLEAGVMKKILSLPGSRARISDVFGIVDSRPVRENFDLSPEDIYSLRQMVKEAGIRWGIDKHHRKRLGLPEYEAASWRWGFLRLLAGYAMQQETGRDFAGMIPCEGIEGDRTRALGKFVTIVETIFSFLKDKDRPKPYFEWITVFQAMADTLFGAGQGEEETTGAGTVQGILADIGTNIEEGVFEHTADKEARLTFDVFREEFVRYLDMRERSARSFLSRGITFSSVVPMRSIPFRVICMIGMNEEDFPRKTRYHDYNLIHLYPQKGDRNTRDNDLYLFLEMLLSAEDKLYVSYTGKSIKDDSERLPSQAVLQLTDYVDSGFVVKGHEKGRVSDYIWIQHPLQPFSITYFTDSDGERPIFTYRENLFYRPEIPAERTCLPEIAPPGPMHDSGLYAVTVNTLTRFFRDTAQFFHRNRVGADFAGLEPPLEDREVYDTDGLMDFAVRELIVKGLINKADTDWELRLMGEREALPFGKYRKTYVARKKREAQALFNKIQTTAGRLSAVAYESAAHKINGVEISVQGIPVIRKGHGDMLVGWHAAAEKPKYLIEALLCHLLFNAVRDAAKEVITCFVFTDEVVTLGSVDRDSAREQLAGIVELYLKGLTTPLVFFPASSYVFAKSLNRYKDPDKAFGQAKRCFFDEYMNPEINNSRHYQHYFASRELFDACREEFVKNSRTVFSGFFNGLGKDHDTHRE